MGLTFLRVFGIWWRRWCLGVLSLNVKRGRLCLTMPRAS